MDYINKVINIIIKSDKEEEVINHKMDKGEDNIHKVVDNTEVIR